MPENSIGKDRPAREDQGVAAAMGFQAAQVSGAAPCRAAGQDAKMPPAATLSKGAVYEVALCSDERRRWRFLGDGDGPGTHDGDPGRSRWWRDVDTGVEFNEASLMYAWTLVQQED